MFDWFKKVNSKVKDLNSSVNEYKKETDNQAIPGVAFVNKAKKLIDRNELELAKDYIYKALAISDRDSIAYKYLGVCEERLGNLKEAIAAYQKSALINDHDKTIWYKLGMVQVNLKQFQDAEKSFETAHKVTPVNTDVETGWGMALLKQKKYMEAHEKFISAIKINRYNFAALLLAAIVEVRLKQYDDAYQKLTFLIKTNPSEACMYEFANLNFLKENYEDAIKYSTYALEYNSNMLPAYLLLGRVYSILQNYEKSNLYYKQAEEKGLINETMYTEWGYSLVRTFHFNEALSIFEKVLKENYLSEEAFIGSQLCKAELGIEVYDPKKEDNAYYYEIKGIYEREQGNISDAIEMFKTALNKDDKEIYNYYRLAKCYEQTDNDTMIKDSYDKLNKFAPNFISGFTDYANYLIKKNEIKDAQRKLRKAEKLDSSNQDICNLLFYTSYILVKDDPCEYNVKEAIMLANKITDFKYPELRVELEGILKNIKK